MVVSPHRSHSDCIGRQSRSLLGLQWEIARLILHLVNDRELVNVERPQNDSLAFVQAVSYLQEVSRRAAAF